MNRPSEPDPSDVSASSEEGGEAPPEGPSAPNAYQFVLLTVLFEGCLGLVGLVVGRWGGLDWEAMLQFDQGPLLVGVVGGLGLFGLHLLLLFPGGERNPLYRSVFKPLRKILLSQLPELPLDHIVLVSAMSGMGEEILFRGWLQTEAGIVVASVLFGIIHIWGKEGIPYGLYAIGMGFVLGGLFEYTGQNLWAPALAHTINNLLALLALRYGWFPEFRS